MMSEEIAASRRDDEAPIRPNAIRQSSGSSHGGNGSTNGVGGAYLQKQPLLRLGREEEEEELHLDDTDLEDHALDDRSLRASRSTSGGGYGGGHGGGSVDLKSQSRFVMICSYFALLGSVMSMSATGPMFLFLQRLGVSPILACVWRNQCTCLFLLVPTFIEWRRLPLKEKAWDRWRVRGTGAVVRRVSRVFVAHSPSSPSSPSTPSSASAASATPQDWHVCWFVFGVSVVWSCSLILWVSSLPFTTTARASLLTSVYPLLLVLWLKFGPAKIALSSGEIIGVLISLAGIATCEVASVSEEVRRHARGPAHSGRPHAMNDGCLWLTLSCSPLAFFFFAQPTEDSRQDPSMLLVGDALCLASAFFIAADIVLSKKAREVRPHRIDAVVPDDGMGATRRVRVCSILDADSCCLVRCLQVMPLFTYTLSTCFVTLCLMTCLSLILEETMLFSLHPTRGVFGWARTSEDILYINVLFGVLEGAIGLLGFNFAVKNLPHLVFSSVQLLDPGMTGVMSWLAGLEAFPSAATFLGIGIVTAGIAVVVVHQHRRETQVGGADEGTKTPVQYQMVQMADKP